MTGIVSLAGLSAAAPLAATIVPAQSEALLVALVIKGDVALWLLVAVASVGDPLTVVAGTMREPLRTFLPLAAAGKVRATPSSLSGPPQPHRESAFGRMQAG